VAILFYCNTFIGGNHGISQPWTALEPKATNLIVPIFVLATMYWLHKAILFVAKFDLATKCWLD
jgi:hypothetical protein